MIRIFSVTDPQALTRQLLSKPGAASTTLEQLKAFNPHVDFQKLAAGTVLLVPDTPDLKAGAAQTVGAEYIGELFDQVNTGIADAVKRVRTGATQVDADRTAIASAVKAAAMKRVIETDPELKKQLAAVDAQFKATQKQASETQSQLAELQKLAAAELAQLRKVLGAD